MKIDYVIPNYENPELLDLCIKSIRQFSGGKIIVCDDHSGSEHLGKITTICKRPGIDLYTNFWNSGFGHSCNVGIAASDADIVILTNSDIILTEDIERETRRYFNKYRSIGILGYLLYYPDGRIQHGGHEYPNNQYYYSSHRDKMLTKEEAKEALTCGPIISVSGALMAVRKKMFSRIGGFKKDYMLAFEDNEYCFRAWHTGYTVHYTSNVSAIHAEGYTRGANDREKVQRKTLDKERQTLQIYAKDIQLYDFKEIDRLIRKAKGEKVEKRRKRIGIIRDGALGDCVLATGIVNEMKRRNHDKDIYVSTLCHYPFAINPNITKIFQDKKVMLEQVDEVYDLNMAYEKRPDVPVVQAYADVCFKKYDINDVTPKLYPILEARSNVMEKVFKDIRPETKVAVIHAGYGFWEQKHWDRQKWDDIAKRLQFMGYKVICVGSGNDYSIPGTITHVGKLHLAEVFEVINMANIFIACDGGIAHIAACTKTPMVTIFSAADPSAFIFRHDKTSVVIPNTECRFCRNKVTPPVTGVICKYGDNRCIKSITVENVMEAIETRIGGSNENIS